VVIFHRLSTLHLQEGSIDVDIFLDILLLLFLETRVPAKRVRCANWWRQTKQQTALLRASPLRGEYQVEFRTDIINRNTTRDQPPTDSVYI